MSTTPLVPESQTQTSTISSDDPRLTSPLAIDAGADAYAPPPKRVWTVPDSWDDSSASPDDRAWIETMAALGLNSKACSAFECGDYYIPILWYQGHYVRLGRTTCQCKTCRDCGTGRMRVHRMFMENPQRFAIVTSESCRTLRLTIHYSTPTPTIEAYMDRIASTRPHLNALRASWEREFSGECGLTPTPEYDRHCRDVVWRVYWRGYDPGHRWFAAAWQRTVGLQAHCESKHRSPDQEAKDGMRWTMEAVNDLLTLPGAERAAWEKAMQGRRFTTNLGSMRGVEVDSLPAVPESGDPEAPYGRCPCGCGGALERPDTHKPMPRSYYDSNFKIVDTGAIKTYSAKIGLKSPPAYMIPPTVTPVAPSPPPW